jgi:acyl-CoA hydrolase
LLRERIIRADVVMLQVSEPNERGEYSFGLVNDYVRAAMQQARVVIAEVNRQIPWAHCDRPLTASEITVALPADRAPLELPSAPFGELERRIAHHLGDLIDDRATLQVGIGAVPEAIMGMLLDRRELGIHSGMIGDSVVELMERGVVTNAHKGIDPGVTVSGVLFGTQRLYHFAHRNPQIRLCPTSYTHHIGTLSRLKKFVSINSALEVDLTGQVNAEAIGSDYIGAVGGQVDYVRAAASPRVACPSSPCPPAASRATRRSSAACRGR